jgi:PAS domain S-box-containing protein
LIAERRNSERADVFFIVEFRLHNRTHACSKGTVSNLSQEGFNFESQDFNLKPRNTLEFTLKHPDSEWSLKAVGTIVWRMDGWYKCVRGIKITNVDEENRQKILETVSFDRNKSGVPAIDEKDSIRVMENEEGKSSNEVVSISGGVESPNSKETADNVIQKLITDGERVRDKKEWYYALFKQAADCMLLMEVQPDGKLIITDVNESACSMHGYKKEELTGKPISFLEDPGSRKYDPVTVQTLLEGKALKFETIHKHKDTKTLPIQESAQLINIEGISYIVAVEREITYAKKNEVMLAERNDELKQTRRKLHAEIRERECIEELWEESDRRYRTLLDSVHNGAIVVEATKNEDRTADFNIEGMPVANTIGASNVALHRGIHWPVLHRTWEVALYSGRQRRHIIPVLVVLIVVSLVTMAISFNNGHGVYIAGQGDVKKQGVLFIDSLNPDGIPPGILFGNINGSETLDITRIKLPWPKPETYQPENLKSKPPRLIRTVRRSPPIKKTEPVKKTISKHLSGVNAGPQKKAIIYGALVDNKFDNLNTYDNGEASALLEGGVYNRTQEEIRCDTEPQQSFKSQQNRLPFMTHQRCK